MHFFLAYRVSKATKGISLSLILEYNPFYMVLAIWQSDNCSLFFRALSALPDLSVWTRWIFEAYVQKDMLAWVSLSLSLPSMPNWIAIFYKFPPCCFLRSDWFPRSTPPAENCYKNISFLLLSFFFLQHWRRPASSSALFETVLSMLQALRTPGPRSYKASESSESFMCLFFFCSSFQRLC